MKWTRQAKVTISAVDAVGWVFENEFFQLRNGGEASSGLPVSRGT